MSERNDFWAGLMSSLHQPNEQEKDKARKRYGLLGVEQPGVMAQIGRGFTDTYEPIKQLYLNAYHPKEAAAYRQQRASDEALYQRGLLAATPQLASTDPLSANMWTLPGTDPWRVVGRTAVALPFAGGSGAILPTIAQAQLWDNATAVKKLLTHYGVLPSSLPTTLPDFMR